MPDSDYAKDYTETALWKKLAGYAAVAGREVVEKVLLLVEVLRDPETPTWAKGVVTAALGYFISPVDVIPDLIPFAGFADDLGTLAAAVATLALHIKPAHVASARARLERWFGHAGSRAMSG